MRRNMDMQIGALTMSMAHNSVPEHPAGLRHLDPDTDFKVRRITSCINEAIHMAANEPSLGLYRIQEHVHRTAPQLAVKKKDLKSNNKRIVETSYDLNLSMDVVNSMQKITNFTRIHEALKTAIETKRKLNIQEEQERARRELDQKNAKIANRSISCNEPAEGYICPVCYFALSAQEELILHWQEQHNLEDCENDIFHEVEMPVDDDDMTINDIILEDDNDMTVIHSPKECRGLSEGEDVVKGFLDSGCNYLERSDTSTSDANGGIEDHFDIVGSTSCEIISDDVKNSEASLHKPPPKTHVIDDNSDSSKKKGDNIEDSLRGSVCDIGTSHVDDNASNSLTGSITNDSNKIDNGEIPCHVDTFSDNLHGPSVEELHSKLTEIHTQEINTDASVQDNPCFKDNISETLHEPNIENSDPTFLTEQNLHEEYTSGLTDNLGGNLEGGKSSS